MFFYILSRDVQTTSAPEDLPRGQETVWGVWYALILPGCIGVGVLGPLTPVAIMAHRQAELRKMQARDLW